MDESGFRLPPTNPDGGWARAHAPLLARPLDLTAAPPVVNRPISTVELHTHHLTSHPTGWAGESRAGLGLLLSGALGAADPDGVAIDDGPCPYCGVVHGCTAALANGGPTSPVYFASVRQGDRAVHALAETPVGLGLALAAGRDREALRAARKTARLAAAAGAVSRGPCGEPRTTGVARTVRYVDAPWQPGWVVSVVWQERDRDGS
ncbi:hypothetical protein ACI3K5_33255 [Streptomyces sp. MPA0124]|uniref:hypothetical protein n=1 Tax=Streptomyces sp. MPA0124 TaxID=3378069 RepID=UPI0022F0DBC8|nr:hypothetical protein [Streptomyces sp. MS2A]